MEKLLNRKQKQLPKENTDYSFVGVDLGGEEYTGVRVLDGPYKDVVYCYGRVKVLQPENPIDPAVLSFDYQVQSIPPNLLPSMVKGDEFKQFAGDVLMSILLHNEEGEYATIREHDTQESDLS